MTISLRSARLIMAAACVCFALAVSPFAHGQATPAANQQKQNAQPAPPVLGLYDLFLEYVGNKDEQIQAGIEGGKAQITPRQDYAAAIGISEGEAQTMLAILIDAFHQGGGSYEDHTVAHLKLVREYGPAEGERMYDEEKAAYGSRQFAALRGAVAKLQTKFSAESFTKLNEYVRETRWITLEPSDPDPCPPNNNPPPGQTTHVACTQFYETLFHLINWDYENNQGAASGDERKNLECGYLPIALPEDKKQAVIDLAIATQKEISETNLQYSTKAHEALDQNIAKYGSERANKMPESPEIEALHTKPATISEERISMLKQALGEHDFKRFDAVLAERNKTIKKADAVSSPNGAPTSELNPAAQP